MRVVGFMQPGGPEVLGVYERPEPHPGPGQARIRVHAVGVSPTDLLMRSGLHDTSMLDAPYVPGMDAAGVIDEVGEGSRWRVGDEVMTMALPTGENGGAYCEFLVVADDAPARIPAGLSLVKAAVIPMNGLTANLVLEHLALEPGSTVAVVGAAGILGNYTVQLATAAGLVVIADAAPKDRDLVTSLGATHVVDRGDDVAERIRALVPDGVDGLVDTALLRDKVLPAVRDGGKYVGVRGWDGGSVRGIQASRVLVTSEYHEHEKLDALRQAVERGQLTPRVAEVFGVADAAEAHRRLEAGGVRGRFVLTF